MFHTYIGQCDHAGRSHAMQFQSHAYILAITLGTRMTMPKPIYRHVSDLAGQCEYAVHPTWPILLPARPCSSKSHGYIVLAISLGTRMTMPKPIYILHNMN